MMARNKSTVVESDATENLIVGFVTKDFVAGDDKDSESDPIAYVQGQRLEFSEDVFADLSKRKLCEKGVFVKMTTAVEGGRYSLRPGEKVWLAPYVYQAWKQLGFCEPHSDDPEVFDTLAARAASEKEALAARDVSQLALEAAQKDMAAMGLEMAAIADQIRTIATTALQNLEGEKPNLKEVGSGLLALLEMLPPEASENEQDPE